MNQFVKSRLILSAAVLLLLSGYNPVHAQDKKNRSNETITINPKNGKKEKITIVVDGDNITVNGKPVEDYKGDNLIIHKGEPLELALDESFPQVAITGEFPELAISPEAIAIPDFNFSGDLDIVGPDGLWNEDAMKGAMLGVITEKVSNGVRIKEVMKESAAEKAGLKAGDVITIVEGKKVNSPEELADIINTKDPNEEVEITYIRNNKSTKVKVKLGERKVTYSRSYRVRPPRPMTGITEPFVHISPRNFNYNYNYSWNNRQHLGLRIQEKEDSSGVDVLEVEDESVAAKAGIKRDDVITEIDGEKVKDLASTRDALREASEKSSYNIKVLRNGSPVTLLVKFPKNLKKADL